MQKTDKCVNCTKSVVCGRNYCGEIVWGCQNPICIFEPIVENPLRDAIIKELNRNVRKNS